jgi:hypothetical protein
VSGGITQLFLNLGTRRACVVSITPRPPLPPGKTLYPLSGGWVGPGADLDRCGKSRPTGIRFPDLPARSESLYQLSYPGSYFSLYLGKKKKIMLFYVLFVLCRSVYCLCVNVYCTAVIGWQPNCSQQIYHIVSIQKPYKGRYNKNSGAHIKGQPTELKWT